MDKPTCYLLITIGLGLVWLLPYIFYFAKLIHHHYHQRLAWLLVPSFLVIFGYYLLVFLLPDKQCASIADPVGPALSDAVASFALQVDVGAIEERVTAEYFFLRVAIDALSIANFILASAVIVTLLAHFTWGIFKNRLRLIGTFRSSRHYAYYIFTDLPYTQISDFLFELEGKGHSVIVVLPRGSLYIQPGTELASLLKNGTHEILVDDVSPALLRKLSHCSKKVLFYSLYEHDEDNQAFAEQALAFYKPLVEKKEKQMPECYVSSQNCAFDDRYGFSKQSLGHLHLYSEYILTAENFVFHNPVTDFVLKKDPTVSPFNAGQGAHQNTGIALPLADFLETLRPLRINFFGFGGINREMFNEMAAAYQLPGEKGWVSYGIYDQDVSAANDLLTRYEFPEGQAGEYFPPFFPFSERDVQAIDFDKESKLLPLLKAIVKRANSGAKEAIFIALGDSAKNMACAYRIQDKVNQLLYLQTAGSFFVPIPVYVYIRENSLFKSALENDDSSGRVVYEIDAFNAQDSAAETLKKGKMDHCPIVIYGRNGRFAEEENFEVLWKLAARANSIYNASVTLRDDGTIHQEEPATDDQAVKTAFSEAPSSDRFSSYATILGMPAKLALLGYRFCQGTSDEKSVKTAAEPIEKLFVTAAPEKEELARLRAICARDIASRTSADMTKIRTEEEIAPAMEHFRALFDFEFTKSMTSVVSNLASMEHNRWCAYQMGQGVWPLCKTSLEATNNQNFHSSKKAQGIVLKNKPLKNVHACLTSNAGLKELGEECLRLCLIHFDSNETFLFEREGLWHQATFVWNDLFTLSQLHFLLKETGCSIAPLPDR